MTALYGVITFLAVLGPLVVLHELGHLFAARLTGTKVIEFGFGFPPRAWGLWTGRTPVRITHETQFEAGDERDLRDTAPPATDPIRAGGALKPGDMIAVAAESGSDGVPVAGRVLPYAKRNEAGKQGSLIAGKLRSVEGDTLFISEMVWSFNYLPLGGFVKMVGEEDPSAEGSLASKSRLARAFVLASGSLVNALLPFLIFAVVAMVPQDVVVGQVRTSAVMPGSPAEVAGLREGDIIVKVDGRRIENVGDLQRAVTIRLGARTTWEVRRAIPDPQPVPGGPRYQYPPGTETIEMVPRWKPPNRAVVRSVTDPETEIALWQARLVEPLAGVSSRLVVVEEAGDTSREISLSDAVQLDPRIDLGDVLKVVPEVTNPTGEISIFDARDHDSGLGVTSSLQEGAVGITIAGARAAVERRWTKPWNALTVGAGQVRDLLVLTKNGLTGLAVGSGNPQFDGPATVGPIGIGQLTGEIATANVDITARIVTLASLAATLSLTLAVINILPIPALDGGRLLFVVIEFLRRGKRISPEREGLVHLAGMVVLLTLIALISVQDILRIIRGESFF